MQHSVVHLINSRQILQEGEKSRALSSIQGHRGISTEGDNVQEVEETIICDSLEDGEVEVQSQAYKAFGKEVNNSIEFVEVNEVIP